MRRLIATSLIATALGGCFNYTSSQVCVFVGGSTVAVSGAIVVFTDDQSGALISRDAAIGIFLVTPAILLAIGGLIGMSVYDSPAEEARQREQADAAEAARARPSASEMALREARERAWRLTKDARVAASQNDCGRVRAIERDVIVLDGEFHATVFVRDVALLRCLAGAPVPSD